MAEGDCRVEIGYEVLSQSLLADEVMEILNLSERHYATSLEMQLLDCTRHLRQTTYSRMIHSGWDLLRFSIASSLLAMGFRSATAKQIGTDIVEALAGELDLGGDLDDVDLPFLISGEIGGCVLEDHADGEMARTAHMTGVLVTALAETLNALVLYLSVTDSCPPEVFRYHKNQDRLVRKLFV